MPTVLVLEDDSDVRTLWIEVLEGSGYRVVAVRDGDEGVAAVSHLRPDLIVSDLLMPPPHSDGIEFLFRVRRQLGGTVPVLVVSAIAPAVNPDVARHLGVRAVCAKPIGARELLQQVEAILGVP